MAWLFHPLDIVSAALTLIGWLLLLLSLAIEKWITATGRTDRGVGDLDITHRIGLFTSESEECCLVQGQIVSALGTICNKNTNTNGCTDFDFHTADFCSYVHARAPHVEAAGRCDQVEGGTIACIIICIVVLLGLTAAAIGIALRVVKPGALAVWNAILSLLLVIVIILFRVLIFDGEEEVVTQRYGPYQDNQYPFRVKNGPSFALMVAAFCFVLLSVISSIASWVVQRKKPVAEPYYEEEPAPPPPPTQMGDEHVFTPERRHHHEMRHPMYDDSQWDHGQPRRTATSPQ